MTGPRDGRPPAADPAPARAAGEFGLIAAFTRGLQPSGAVSVGVGDDGAVFRIAGEVVVSTDLLVEGVHFRCDWSSAEQVGRKAVAVNVADLEAMGARPVAMVVALGLPARLGADWALEFSRGVRVEADRAGIALVGGDTTAARDATVCVTVMGETAGRDPVLRSGAVRGDVVAVRGRLGWAAAGLALLERGLGSPSAAVAAQQVPEPPYGAGREAAGAGAHAMLDVSDGLVGDLGHVAEASRVVIDVDRELLVPDQPVVEAAVTLGLDPVSLVLGGGEDHALAACFAPGQVPDGWQRVGSVRAPRAGEDPGVLVDGAPYLGHGGWDHFGT